MKAANLDDSLLARQEAILSSMTPKERRDPRIINASRKRRIASGAGVNVPDVNKILKQYQEMNSMMKKVRKMSKKGQLPGGLPGMPGGGDLPADLPGAMPDGLKLPPGFKFSA